jgi:hypothetical protein
MKRDLDLARQLLVDIEGRGADCSLSVLRSGPNHEAEERIRYHLRLLIDAGLLKEVDRAANGVPCVRLTDAGHELIELSRSEGRWRRALQACHERTGGVSLAIVRAILIRWALAERPRARSRYVLPQETVIDRRYDRRLDDYRLEPFTGAADAVDGRVSPGGYFDDDVRYVRVRPRRPEAWLSADYALNGWHDDGYGAVIPDYLI